MLILITMWVADYLLHLVHQKMMGPDLQNTLPELPLLPQVVLRLHL